MVAHVAGGGAHALVVYQQGLGALFAQVGIEWKGQVRTAPLPSEAAELTVWDSPALAVLVRDISNALEEKEREEFTRLKVIKRNMNQ